MATQEYKSFFDNVENEDISFKESSGKSNKDMFPMTFLGDEGTYNFRLYPEIYNGKPRPYRVIWMYKLQDGTKVLVDPKNKEMSTKMKELMAKAKAEGPSSGKFAAFNFNLRRVAVAVGYLYKAPKSKYIAQENTCCALIFKNKHIDCIDACLKQVEENGVKYVDFINPFKPNKAFSILIKGKGKDTKVNSTLSFSELEMPELTLPEGIEYTGLDDLYVKSNNYMTEEQFVSFEEFILQKIEDHKKYKSKTTDPKDNEENPGYSIEDVEPVKKKSEKISTSTVDKCKLKREISLGNIEEVVSLSEEVRSKLEFGNPPEEQTLTCMMCDNQLACLEAAGK